MVSCKICNRKINKLYIELYTCKCLFIFCGNHLSDHSCTFNHRKEVQKILKSKLPIFQSDKGLVKI